MSHLFRFVVEQGFDSSADILQPLFAFHEKFVNAKLRRLREHRFKDVCALNNAWLRLILLQSAYAVDTGKIKDTWIECFGPSSIATIMKTNLKPVRDEVANIVRTFHKTYAVSAAYDHKPPGVRTKFLGKIGKELGIPC